MQSYTDCHRSHLLDAKKTTLGKIQKNQSTYKEGEYGESDKMVLIAIEEDSTYQKVLYFQYIINYASCY